MEESIHHNSSHFAAISDASPVQAQVIEALAQGQTVSAAAEKVGVHRTTIHHWIRNEPQFKAAVKTAQSEYAAELKTACASWPSARCLLSTTCSRISAPRRPSG